MKKYLVKGLGIALALTTVMAVPAQAAFVVNDLNDDGHIDGRDAVVALNAALKNPDNTTVTVKTIDNKVQQVTVDLDGDGKLTANDAALYMENGLVLKITATRKSTGVKESLNYAVTRGDRVIDVLDDILGGTNTNNIINKYQQRVLNRLDSVKVTANGVTYDVYSAEGQEKVYNFLNNVEFDGKGNEVILDKDKFLAAMPDSRSQVTTDFAKNLHKNILEAANDKLNVNSENYDEKFAKDYANALADKIEKNKSNKGNGKAVLTYDNPDGTRTEITSPKLVSADLVRNLGYSSVTVAEVLANYGRNAELVYNDYVVEIEVLNSIN